MSRLAGALDDLRALDTLAARLSAVARRDPRAQLVVTLAFTVTVASFDRYSVAALLPLALFPTVQAAEAGLPVRLLARLLVLASPAVLLIGLFNPLFDPAPVVWLAGQAIGGGWVSLLSMVLRFALTASAALALLAGTGMPTLCAALCRLGLPAAWTTQLLLLHRYMFLLADEARRLHTARSLRAGPARRLPMRQWVPLLGQLLLRSFDRAGRVHQAMQARGFDGDLRPGNAWQWRSADTVFVAGWCALFALLRGVDLPQAIGRLLTAGSP